MYEKLPNLVIGFHGCNKDTFDQVIINHKELKASENSYDWLGHGIYFWEHNLQRAKEWGELRYGDDARVVGAVIDLGNCLNLTDSASEIFLKEGYNLLQALTAARGIPMPKNRPSTKTQDILLRDLDCAVIEQIRIFKKTRNDNPFDSVRGVFVEGEPPYEGSEFRAKTHIQLCICNPNCIKGYFAPKSQNKKFSIP